jgi:hypothetical protein
MLLFRLILKSFIKIHDIIIVVYLDAVYGCTGRF